MKKQKFNTHRLSLYEQAIERWKLGKYVCGITPSMVADYLVWLHQFHPELRERVNEAIDDMTSLYRDGLIFNEYNIGQI